MSSLRLSTSTLLSITAFVYAASGSIITKTCKVTPDSAAWPKASEWSALNDTVDGRLLKPAPPAAICHPRQPTFDLRSCQNTNWWDAATYANDPVGIINPNWSNDSCLPPPQYPCSGQGYPTFVVNATSARHVAAGVDFARKHRIRLNVKGSGHDYLGRSVAPNALSIWTKHIRGMEFHDLFKPSKCPNCPGLPAVTLGAGEDWGEIYPTLDRRGLTAVGGTGDTIGLGGYLTGGGHSPLSAEFGLAVDQVIEMEVVTASGDILTANEAQNPDLFWAMRGGGGATFGIMTSVTIKTFPSMPIAAIDFTVGAAPGSDAYWNFSTFIISQSPRLQQNGVMSYAYLSPGSEINGTLVSFYTGQLLMPNGTVEELESATAFLKEYVSDIPGVFLTVKPHSFTTLYAWYQLYKNTYPIGTNVAVGNRLLDGKALSNVTALREAIEVATPMGTIANANLIAGPGLWGAKPAGGSDSVTPAWRSAYVEYAVPVSWSFLDSSAERSETNLLTNVYMDALRKLAPDTGSYLNEGDVNEPNFRTAYWGENYAKLLSIKQEMDPLDVFWCKVCVGSEKWQVEEGNNLCLV